MILKMKNTLTSSTSRSRNQLTRRDFVAIAAAAGVGALCPFPVSGRSLVSDTAELEVHLFSKHLQFLNYDEMAEVTAEIGLDGLDLTVRPGGHVLPERVEDDLPKAVDALHRNGLKTVMMTTSIGDAFDPLNRRVLETAAKLGITYYRTGWYTHPEDRPIPESLEEFKVRIAELEQLNREIGIKGGYQNHAGNFVGASIWELWELLRGRDFEWMGCQYDIRHAYVEGGLSWPQGLRLIYPAIQTVIAKDVRWAVVDGKWQPENVPIGEGMINWMQYFGLLKKYQVSVPLSLHLEYPLGGAEHGASTINIPRAEVIAAIKQDMETVKRLWRESPRAS